MKDPRALRSRALMAGSVVSLLYFILVGGTPLARSVDALWTLNIVLSAALIAAWFALLWRYPGDKYDGIAVVALVLFCVAAVASRFPRQSFDATTGAMAYVALFGVARRVLADARTRELTVLALASTGLAVGIAFSLVWVAIYADWLNLSGFESWPPLGLQVLTGQFANRYDVMFLVLLLAPAVWFTARGRWGGAVLALSAVTALAVTILAGSRGAIVAIAVASAATWLSDHRTLVPRSRGVWIWVVGVVAALLAAWPLGLLGTLGQRLFYLSSIFLRFELWASSFAAWLQRPLTGMGPGTFPFDLQFSDYFSHATIAVRHPDNVVVQAAAESGVLGLAALGLIGWIGLSFCLRPGAPFPARWALVFFAVACASANPSDFTFLVIPAVIWAAVAAPPTKTVAVTGIRVSRIATVCLATAALLVALDLGAARYFHTAGKTAWARRDAPAAEHALAVAVALDPSMALYRRELGTIELYLGNNTKAVRLLRVATQLAPSDTTAWRARALAALRTGDGADALDSAGTAQRLRPSESQNLVVRAYVERVEGDSSAAEASMREALRVAPELAASDGWQSLALDRVELTRQALRDWQREVPPLDSQIEKPVWLAFLASNPALVDQAASRAPGDIGLAYRELGQLLRCDGSGVVQRLSALAPHLGDTPEYWEVRVVAEGLSAEIGPTTVRLGRRVALAFTPTAPEQSIIGPNTVDVDGYRIDPFPAVVVVDLPTPRNGRSALLFAPRSALDAVSVAGEFRCASTDTPGPP